MSYARPVRPRSTLDTADPVARDPGASPRASDGVDGVDGVFGPAVSASRREPREARAFNPITEGPSEAEWRRVGTLGVGIVIGALLGAGAALLLAPQSGEETRRLIGARARRLQSQAGDSWGDLGEELRAAARRRRRGVRRGVTRGRWAVADLLDE